MSQVVEYLWLIIDGIWAAFASLNIVPVVIVAAIIGLIQSKPAHFAVKALICLGLAILIDALWPLSFGGAIVIPAVTEPEVQIQIAVLYALGYLILKAMMRVKRAISLTPVTETSKTD